VQEYLSTNMHEFQLFIKLNGHTTHNQTAQSMSV